MLRNSRGQGGELGRDSSPVESLPSFQKVLNSICNARERLGGNGDPTTFHPEMRNKEKKEKMHVKHFDLHLVGRSMS